MSVKEQKTLLFSALKTSQFKPDLARLKKQKYLERLQAFAPLLEAVLNEPYFVDDAVRQAGVNVLLSQIVETWELLICLDGENVAGFMLLMPIIPGRSASLLGWVSPGYRAGAPLSKQRIAYRFIREDLLPYVFDTLGLVKLRASVCVENKSSIRFCQRVGFSLIGTSIADGVFSGKYHDTLELELLNPNYFGAEVIANGRRRKQQRDTERDDSATDDATAQPADNAVAAESSTDSPAGNKPKRRNNSGARKPRATASRPKNNKR